MRPDDPTDLAPARPQTDDETVLDATVIEPTLDDLSRQAQEALDEYLNTFENDLLDLALRRARRVGDDIVSAVHIHDAARLLTDGGVRTRLWISQGSCILLGGGIGGAVAVASMDHPPIRLFLLTIFLMLVGGVGFGSTMGRRT